MAESAGRPEVVTAAAELVRRHLVVLVLLEHPELDALAARGAKNAEEMFASTAAQEMLEAAAAKTIAKLRQQGSPRRRNHPGRSGREAPSANILEVKAQGLLLAPCRH